MPKQRLVDFRGGLNKKISPHMIGDSQGQAANDVDLGSVRLQGRRKIDPEHKAEGSFFYELGNIVSSEERKPRWVSWDPKDDSYINGAVDFAVWNRDLYVAINVEPGEIQVFRDGGLDADVLGFDPPLTVTLATGSGFPSNSQLHGPVTGRENIDDSINYQTVTSQTAGAVQWGSTASNLGNYRHIGTASGVDADNAGQTWYIWQKYIGSSATQTYAYSTSNSSSLNALFYAQTLVSNAYTTWMTDNWSAVGWNRTQTGWSEANNHPAAAGHSNASTQSYNVFTRSGSSTIYAIGSGSNAQCYNITGGGTASGGTATEGPLYTAQYKWTWNRDSGTTGGIDTDYERDGDNFWDLRVVKDNMYLAFGATGHPAAFVDPMCSLSFKTPNGQISTYQGLEPNSHAAYAFTITRGAKVSEGDDSFSDFYLSYEDYPSTKTFWYVFVPPATGQMEITIWCDGEYKGNFNGAGADLSNTTEIVINGIRWYRGVFAEAGDNGSLYNIRVPFKREYYKIHVQSPGAAKTTGTRQIIWNGAVVSQVGNVQESDHNNQQIIGGSTYTASGSDRNASGDVYEYAVIRVTNNPVNYTPLTFTPVTQPSTGAAAQYRYNIEHKDYRFSGGQAGIPDTPAYTRDWSRYYLYRVATTADNSFGVASWSNDPAKGTVGDGWLQSGSEKRMITTDTQGYFIQNVRVEDGLPVISQEMTRLDQATVTINPATDVRYLPRRLNFTVIQPTDYANSGHLCFKLIRKDSFGDIDLGYWKKTEINLAMSGGTGTISGLDSSAQYRVKWHCYQEATITINNSATSTNVTAKSEEVGIQPTTGSTITFTLNIASSGNYGFDLWLEERILQPVADSSAGDVWALVGSWDAFKYSTLVELTRSDFLDVYKLGLTSSSLGGTESQTLPPKYLKFLRESNNFFYAVGTQLTADDRYVNAEINKADSYLFISEYNNPRNWPIDGFLEFDDAITGMFPYPGEMIVWTQSGTFRVFGSAHDQMRKIKLATTEGMVAGYHRTAALVQNYLVWVSQSGICVYDGTNVSNITRSRMEVFTPLGTSAHAAQFDGQYYVVGANEKGWMVDFTLEGFPVVEIDLGESDRPPLTNNGGETLQPVLVYRASTNELYSRRGIVNSNGQTRNVWSYKTRGFDGKQFGSLKLVKSVVFNGTGSGLVQVYLDGIPVYDSAGKAVSIRQPTPNATTQPAKIYLPALPMDPATMLVNQYGLPVADVWSVEILSWEGQLDWIDTEFEILSQ